MKNNKGFTLVEVIVAFALTMVVVLFLFQIIITLKQIYNDNYIKSNLVLKQANINQMINKDFFAYNYNIETLSVQPLYITPNSGCYRINFNVGNSKDICYDKENDTISYNDYEFELVKNSKIGNVIVKVEENILYIDIPITYPDLEGNYGIKTALVGKI